MQENDVLHEPAAAVRPDEDRLTFAQIFRLIGNGWRVILTLTIAFAAVALFFSLMSPTLYRTYYVIMPTPANNDALRSNTFSFDVLGRQSLTPDWQMYMSLLNSSTLAGRLEKKTTVMQHLFASQWDREKGDWITHPDFDSLSLKGKIRWLLGKRTVQAPDKFALMGYLKTNLNVATVPDTSQVMISIDSTDPSSALFLLANVHQAANDIVREAELSRAVSQRKHLLDELQNISVADYRQTLMEILSRVEAHIMTASVGGQYAAMLVDGPVTLPTKVAPQPMASLKFAVVGGIIIGLVLVVFFPVNDALLLAGWRKLRALVKNRRSVIRALALRRN